MMKTDDACFVSLGYCVFFTFWYPAHQDFGWSTIYWDFWHWYCSIMFDSALQPQNLSTEALHIRLHCFPVGFSFLYFICNASLKAAVVQSVCKLLESSPWSIFVVLLLQSCFELMFSSVRALLSNSGLKVGSWFWVQHFCNVCFRVTISNTNCHTAKECC